MNNRELAHRLRSRRFQLGYSQRHLSQRLGVTQPLLCQWEKGHHAPNLKNLQEWAQALDLELAFKETKPVAYSAWGAFVYKDGARRVDREDVAPFQEGGRPTGPQLFMDIVTGTGEVPEHEQTMHAVLGDGDVRLTVYKDRPDLWVRTPQGFTVVDTDAFITMREERRGERHYRGEYMGLRFTAHCYRKQDSGLLYPMIDVEMWDVDESRWVATCGYLYGAGHTDQAV